MLTIGNISIPHFATAVEKPCCMICAKEYDDPLSVVLYFRARILICHSTCFPHELEDLNELWRWIWLNETPEKCIRNLVKYANGIQIQALNTALLFCNRGFTIKSAYC